MENTKKAIKKVNNKRDQEKELYQQLSLLKKWQRRAFALLVNKGVTGQSIADIGRDIGSKREVISRFYHSKTYEDLSKLYAQEEVMLEYLPLARKTIKDMLTDKETPSSIRAKIALEIYKMARLSKAENESQKADNIYNFNIHNKTLNQLNINELEDMAKNEMVEIKKLIGEEKDD